MSTSLPQTNSARSFPPSSSTCTMGSFILGLSADDDPTDSSLLAHTVLEVRPHPYPYPYPYPYPNVERLLKGGIRRAKEAEVSTRTPWLRRGRVYECLEDTLAICFHTRIIEMRHPRASDRLLHLSLVAVIAVVMTQLTQFWKCVSILRQDFFNTRNARQLSI